VEPLILPNRAGNIDGFLAGKAPLWAAQGPVISLGLEDRPHSRWFLGRRGVKRDARSLGAAVRVHQGSGGRDLPFDRPGVGPFGVVDRTRENCESDVAIRNRVSHFTLIVHAGHLDAQKSR
jgi:hypothetical protein